LLLYSDAGRIYYNNEIKACFFAFRRRFGTTTIRSQKLLVAKVRRLDAFPAPSGEAQPGIFTFEGKLVQDAAATLLYRVTMTICFCIFEDEIPEEFLEKSPAPI
jgi:hypothetical protein